MIVLLALFATANVFVTRTQACPLTKARMYAAATEALCAKGLLSASNANSNEMKMLSPSLTEGKQCIYTIDGKLISSTESKAVGELPLGIYFKR